jgi:hypothetical protein
MLTRPDKYRENARECEQLAAMARYQATKNNLLLLAHEWRQMANDAEKTPAIRNG